MSQPVIFYRIYLIFLFFRYVLFDEFVFFISINGITRAILLEFSDIEMFERMAIRQLVCIPISQSEHS